MSQGVEISVIIPNLHSPIVDQTIESVLAQKTDLPFEVIVVGMDKWGLVDRYAERVNFLQTAQSTPPGTARNIGAASAGGETFLFIDSDCIASAEWIENHLTCHQESDRGLIVGGGVTFPADNYFTLADNISWFHEFMVHINEGEKQFLPSLNLSISRATWEAIGGFNHNPAGEDTDFSLRAKSLGIPLVFNTGPSVRHLPNRRNLKALFRHAFVFGQYSIKANPDYWDILKVPYPLKKSLLTLLLSPLLAMGVIINMIFHEKLPIKYWHTLPMVYLIKIAWCFGFAKQLRTQQGNAL